MKERTKIEITCSTCGEKVLKSRTDYERNKTGNFYCNRECMKVGHSKNYSGSNAPFYGKNHDKDALAKMSGVNHWNYGNRNADWREAVCKNCGRTFEYNHSKYRKDIRKPHRFCSRECRYEYDKSTRIIKPCSWCGEPVTRAACFEDQEHFFCSRQCLGKYVGSNQPTGEDHWHHGKRGPETSNWRGGKSFEQYGLDFNIDFKESVRKRDNYTCQLCGKRELVGTERKLDIHHIDYNKKNNRKSNVVSLCRNCHAKTNGNRSFWTAYFQALANNREGATTIPSGSTPQANGGGSARQLNLIELMI